MKSIVSAVMLAVCLMLGQMLPAGAAYKPVHGDFARDSSGCGACHNTHAASLPGLLVGEAGFSQTDFCLICHGSGAESPFDVYNGRILSAGPVTDNGFARFQDYWASSGAVYAHSNAGGFYNSFNSKQKQYLPSTSVHGLEDTRGYMPQYGDLIPGGSAELNEDFKCTSCHNPHLGGSGAPNPRLLKLRPLAATGDRYVTMEWENPADPWRVTGYGTGINEWCGACHDKFNRGDNAGHIRSGSGPLRHAMGVRVNTAAVDTGIDTGVPLGKTGINEYLHEQLNCLTCHRAHGTAAQMTREKVLPNGQKEMITLDNATYLLRLNNREACYNCHGAAEWNTAALTNN